MTIYNTGNPIGSTEVKDLYDNAQNFDTLANTTTQESVPDRRGVPRMTLHGFEQEAKRRFESIKFQPPIPYAPGIEVTTSSLTVDYLGVIYYALPSALPFTTGAWNPAQWSPLQNTNPGNDLLVFDDYASASAAAATLPDGQRIEIEADEQHDGRRTRNVVNGGAVVFERYVSEFIDIKDYGAVGNGIHDDGPAEITARSAAGDGAVFYPNADWFGLQPARNIYGASYDNALFGRWVSGLESQPVSEPSPVLWATKFTSAKRSVNPSEWDSGAVYGALIKVSGDAFGAGITGAVRHNGGSGHLIGGHFRGEARHANAEAWGGWSYGAVSGPAATVNGGSGAKSVIAHEFNINNQGPDVGWNAGAIVGSARGIVIATVDGGGNAQVGMSLGSGAGEEGKWWTGIHLRGNSFGVAAESLDQVGNGEAFRLDGSTLANATGAIRFYGGNFRYGISFAESGFSSNCAILLADNQRIVVGTGPNSTRYLSFNRTEGWANLNNLLLRINGVQVLGTQKPAISNVAEVTAAACVVTINSILNTMRAHGLIAT